MTVPQILRRSQLEARLGLARSSIYKMMNEGTFPRPVKLGLRAVGWRSEDIEAWLEDLQEQSND